MDDPGAPPQSQTTSRGAVLGLAYKSLLLYVAWGTFFGVVFVLPTCARLSSLIVLPPGIEPAIMHHLVFLAFLCRWISRSTCASFFRFWCPATTFPSFAHAPSQLAWPSVAPANFLCFFSKLNTFFCVARVVHLRLLAHMRRHCST